MTTTTKTLAQVQAERFVATRAKELKKEEAEFDALEAYLAEFETEEAEEELLFA